MPEINQFISMSDFFMIGFVIFGEIQCSSTIKGVLFSVWEEAGNGQYSMVV